MALLTRGCGVWWRIRPRYRPDSVVWWRIRPRQVRPDSVPLMAGGAIGEHSVSRAGADSSRPLGEEPGAA
jgi:hypothetical protein